MDGTRRIDLSEPAHLRDRAGYTPPIHRFAPSRGLSDVVRRYWLPVWSVPDGRTSTQRVLQYPVCQVVVSDAGATFVGVRTGLSTQELAGVGWALGAMLQPAPATVLLERPVSSVTDQTIDLSDVPGLDGAAIADAVRAAIDGRPEDPTAQQAAVACLERALLAGPPMDGEGLLVNDVVAYVEREADVRRVGQICEAFDLTERSLQRLTARRLGLTPKWLIQRRRLHEAAASLRAGVRSDLARVAANLGYADQAHFTHDFRTVTGLTPGQYAAQAE